MAHCRVTDYFPQKKKSSIPDPARRKGRRDASAPTGGLVGDNGDPTPSQRGAKTLSSACSKSIQRDFLRNIAAATEDVEDAETDVSRVPDIQRKAPASPVTPKRPCVDAEPGDAPSATRHYSTAKKRRQGDPSAHTPDHRADRKTARKKLVLSKAEEVCVYGWFCCVLLRLTYRR